MILSFLQLIWINCNSPENKIFCSPLQQLSIQRSKLVMLIIFPLHFSSGCLKTPQHLINFLVTCSILLSLSHAVFSFHLPFSFLQSGLFSDISGVFSYISGLFSDVTCVQSDEVTRAGFVFVLAVTITIRLILSALNLTLTPILL